MSDISTANFDKIMSTIKTIATSIFGLLAIAAVALAIFLAYKFFTASDETKRKNAKAQLIYAIIGVIVLVLMLAFITPLTDLITKALPK